MTFKERYDELIEICDSVGLAKHNKEQFAYPGGPSLGWHFISGNDLSKVYAAIRAMIAAWLEENPEPPMDTRENMDKSMEWAVAASKLIEKLEQRYGDDCAPAHKFGHEVLQICTRDYH